MKHTLKVTILLILFFFMAQFVGLLIINQYIDHKRTLETKEIVFKPLPYGFERPEVTNQSTSFIYITIAIIIGTFLVLMLVRFKKQFIWRYVFLFAVWSTLSIAFSAFINAVVAAVLALIISILRVYKPNLVIQNVSEIFIYGGLAASVVNIFNLFAAFMLLIVISIYDFIAVFKTKHMITLANFQSKSKVFAGLLIPYAQENQRFSGHQKSEEYERVRRAHSQVTGFFSEKGKVQIANPNLKPKPGTKKSRVAVLGGGDIGFTLIFAGVVMKGLMLNEPVLVGFLKTLIIPIFVSMALLVLLLNGQQNKFYPAMPVLSLGCFLGYLVVLLI